MSVILSRYVLVAVIFMSQGICGQTKDNSGESVNTVSLKQAKGRLKAIARGFMIENQKDATPFELHQKWRLIKKDVYHQLRKESYLNEHKHKVVDETVMPGMSDVVFKKLVELRTDAPKERRKKYLQSSDLITIKASAILVRERLRKHGIIMHDRPLLFEDIMFELKKYTEDEKMISRKLVKIVSDQIIKKFKTYKSNLQTVSPRSYLQEFIAGWHERFTNQIGKQDWNVAQ